jgi:hypothetical protein
LIFIYCINPSSPPSPPQGPSIIEEEPRFDEINFDFIMNNENDFDFIMNNENETPKVWGDNLLKGPVIDFT